MTASQWMVSSLTCYLSGACCNQCFCAEFQNLRARSKHSISTGDNSVSFSSSCQSRLHIGTWVLFVHNCGKHKKCFNSYSLVKKALRYQRSKPEFTLRPKQVFWADFPLQHNYVRKYSNLKICISFPLYEYFIPIIQNLSMGILNCGEKSNSICSSWKVIFRYYVWNLSLFFPCRALKSHHYSCFHLHAKIRCSYTGAREI